MLKSVSSTNLYLYTYISDIWTVSPTLEKKIFSALSELFLEKYCANFCLVIKLGKSKDGLVTLDLKIVHMATKYRKEKKVILNRRLQFYGLSPRIRG